MRKFYIYCDNATFSLNGEDGLWLLTPSGMGATMATTYASITDGFFSCTENKAKQGTIAGELAWVSNAYSGYKSLVDAMLSSDSLTIGYNPNGTEYKADVKLNYITKGESYGGKILRAPISFIMLTPWYTTETITATGTATIAAGGQLVTSVRVQTTTDLTNPVLTMTDADGEFQRLELTLTTASGTALEYSNHHYDSHIYYGDEDAIQYADLSTAIFGRSRKAFTLSMTGAEMTIEVKKWWRTV